MNGQNLLLGLSYIDHKFIEESEQDAVVNQQRKRFRKPFLLAAIIALMLFLMGCAAAIYLTLAEEPWASIPRVEATDIPAEDVQVSVTHVSPTHLVYQCDLVGFGSEEKSVFLLRNAPYTIEQRTESGWQELPRKMENIQQVTEKVLTAGHHRDSIDWSMQYGYLDVGVYRITTQFVDGHEPMALEFEITGQMQTDGFAMAKNLVNQEFWHIRETYSQRYGSLDGIPTEAKAQYQQPDTGGDDLSEYWKCGDDYLHLMYDGDQIIVGMMYKDGVKYKLVREWESNDAPIVGWMPWPDMDMNRLTAWASCLGNDRYECDMTYREDGSIDTLAFSTTETDDLGVDSYSTIHVEIVDTSRQEIAKVLEEQNTNVWQDFSWEEDQKIQKPLDTAFVNTSSNPISTAGDALALAEKECTVAYNQVKVYRDEAAGIWKIEYQIMYGYQGYQYVYLNDDGITVMISGSGSKVEQWQTDYPGA